MGSEPAAASGRNRQAEHRESQGALEARLCEFPGSGVNDSPVGCQSRPDRRASSEEKESYCPCQNERLLNRSRFFYKDQERAREMNNYAMRKLWKYR